MSIFKAGLALQLPKKWATGLSPPFMGQDCVLCVAPSGDRVMCRACEAALPLIGTACAGCACPLPHPGLCGECLSRPFAFDDAAARYEYAFPIDRLVLRFKFAGDLAMGRWLALQLAEHVCHERPHLVVAPPLAPGRLRERGFNQALEIARVVARRVGARCEVSGVIKTGATSPQAGLSRRDRRANLRQAFRCSVDVAGKHVAVVDDVMTTGATMDAMAAVLKHAGAARVSAWSVARTVR